MARALTTEPTTHSQDFLVCVVSSDLQQKILVIKMVAVIAWTEFINVCALSSKASTICSFQSGTVVALDFGQANRATRLDLDIDVWDIYSDGFLWAFSWARAILYLQN